jgi:4-amino-4-deoxy-L-arabinose transferase-like glycosyltransferase
MKPFIQNPARRKSQLTRDLAVIVLVVIGCAAPFLSQPFHMDDNFYMDMARSARAHPVYPYDSPYDFGGFHAPDMASHSHPPLQAYFLAAVQSLAGEEEGREWIYHAAAIVFPLMAALSLYFISALFLERPIWPALAMAVCPLLLVMGHTLMTDVPMLAYWLAATACFLWAAESARRSLYAASALFLFAAMFTSYQSAALIPLLGFYQIRKHGRVAGWVSLFLPVLAMGAWIGMSSSHFGRMILGDTAGYIQSRHATTLNMLGTKLLALFEYQGWLIVFPLFFLYVFARGLKGRLFLLALLASTYVAQARVPEYRLADKAIFVIGLATGIFVSGQLLALAGHAFRRERSEARGFGNVEAQFIVLWYFGVAAYCLILFTEGSARYILPLVPPVLIFFFRRLEIAEALEYRAESRPLMNSAMVASGSLVLSLVWGMFLAQADFEFARVYPLAAHVFTRMFSGLDTYVTGEWGFRYYFNRAGAKPLPADESSVTGGSVIVKPALAMPYGLPPDLESMTMSRPLARFSFDLKTPFRTMDSLAPAGFYSTGWGLIPFSFSDRSLETIEVRQVNFMIERLPLARIECTTGILPWPGYVGRGEQALAILAKPDTRIVYPWDFRRPMNLTLKIGMVQGAVQAENTIGDFEILYRDSQGRIIARVDNTLEPGKRKEDLEWQPVKLLVPGSATDGATLEFRYHGRGSGSVTGAFAEAWIMPE